MLYIPMYLLFIFFYEVYVLAAKTNHRRIPPTLVSFFQDTDVSVEQFSLFIIRIARILRKKPGGNAESEFWATSCNLKFCNYTTNLPPTTLLSSLCFPRNPFTTDTNDPHARSLLGESLCSKFMSFTSFLIWGPIKIPSFSLAPPNPQEKFLKYLTPTRIYPLL